MADRADLPAGGQRARLSDRRGAARNGQQQACAHRSGQSDRTLDPERELRAARDALDLADTAANRLRVADALAELGRHGEALALYEDLVTRMPGEEARCRYAALLLDRGWERKAVTVLEEVESRMKRLDRARRAADADMYRWATDTLARLRARA